MDLERPALSRIDEASLARDPWLRALLILLTVIAVIYLGQMTWSIVGLVVDLIMLSVVAWLISFVLEAPVAGLARITGWSRPGAVFAVYGAVLTLLAAGFALLVPSLAAQSVEAAGQLPELATRIGAQASMIESSLAEHGIQTMDYSQQILRSLETVGPMLVSNGLVIVGGAAAILGQLLLTVILSLYLMLDSQRIGKYLLEVVPDRYRDDFTYLVSSVYRAFGGFLRGQIIQSLVYACGVALIMLGTGLPFVALASVLGSLAIFIPLVGPLLGVVPPLIVAVLVDPGRAIIVLVLTIVLNLLVMNVVQPRVMSQQVGLHPILVLLAVLVGARLAGVWGALFGVPIAAVIVMMLSFYRLTVSERKQRLLQVTEAPETVADEAMHPPSASPSTFVLPTD
jgi:predicted PurR-regulated permease PerM